MSHATLPQAGTHERPHPTVQLYVAIAVFLAIITSIEVAIYYVPDFHPGGRWRLQLGGPALPDRRRAWFFTAAMLVLSVALLSPLDRLADEELFSVHTVQHLLLILAFPPLLLAGLPGWMLRPLLLCSATVRT